MGGCGTVYRRAAFLAVGIDIPLIGKGAAVRYAAIDIERVGCVALGIDIVLLRYQLDVRFLGCEFAVRGDPHVDFCGLRRDFLPRGIDGVGQGDRHRIVARCGVILHPVPDGHHIVLRSDVCPVSVGHDERIGVGAPVIVHGKAFPGERAACGIADHFKGRSLVIELRHQAPYPRAAVEIVKA